MLRILRDKFVRLGRDDDGMAMVVTLAVFMFMWLVCMGVYAIGTAVKTRIHLQNACDAAAYSAAVVQADTLSRIATINRAMAWTYAEMTHKEMDYIIFRWMNHVVRHWKQDRRSAISWNNNSVCEDTDDSHFHKEGPVKNLSGVGSDGFGWFIGGSFEGFASGLLIGASSFRANLGRFGHMNQMKIGDGVFKYVRAADAPPWEVALETQIKVVEDEIRSRFYGQRRLTKDQIHEAVAYLKWLSSIGVWDPQTVQELEEMLDMMDHGSEIDPPNVEGMLKFAILQDRINIGAMNICIRELAGRLSSRIDNTVREILKANLPVTTSAGDESGGMGNGCKWIVVRSKDPRPGSDDAYFTNLDNSADDEKRFLGFVGLPPFNTPGIDRWYVRKDNNRGGGIGRYCPVYAGPKAEWWWWGDWWVCGFGDHARTGGSHPGPCYHFYEDKKCHGYCQRNIRTYDYDESAYAAGGLMHPFEQTAHLLPQWSPGYYLAFQVVCPAGCTNLYNSCYVGQTARPLVLTRDYFGKNGTITVGVARHERNPWTSLLGSTIRGIFSAFNPYTEWVWAFSSAKAGYKFLSDDDESLAYRIDWWPKIQSWNLCQSDWDAVHIPVRRAECFAESGEWKTGRMDFLPDYLAAAWHWLWNSVRYATWEVMRAGGFKNIDRPEWKDGSGRNLPPDYYRFDQWRELPEGRTWDWEQNGVTAQWQIEKKNAPIDWSGIQKVMFH